MARCLKCLTELNYAIYFCETCKKDLKYGYRFVQGILLQRHVQLFYGMPYEEARRGMEEFGWENYEKLFQEHKAIEKSKASPDVLKLLAKVVGQVSRMLRGVNGGKACGPCQGTGVGRDYDKCTFCAGTGNEMATVGQITLEHVPVKERKALSAEELAAIDDHYRKKEEEQRNKGWNW